MEKKNKAIVILEKVTRKTSFVQYHKLENIAMSVVVFQNAIGCDFGLRYDEIQRTRCV
jgi:hypothetical protein